jgi:hypothetical protein
MRPKVPLLLKLTAIYSFISAIYIGYNLRYVFVLGLFGGGILGAILVSGASLFIGLLYVVTGMGLLTSQNWARILGGILSIGALFIVLYSYNQTSSPIIISLSLSLINLAIMYYLLMGISAKEATKKIENIT